MDYQAKNYIKVWQVWSVFESVLSIQASKKQTIKLALTLSQDSELAFNQKFLAIISLNKVLL